jgi:sec-independent protein translocase protein TatA
MITSILFISGSEIFIVMLVVLLLFGSKKIPELAKGLGKGMKEFKRATEDIKKELHESTSEIRETANEFRRDLDDVKGKLLEETSDIKKNAEELRSEVNQVKGDAVNSPYEYDGGEEPWRDPYQGNSYEDTPYNEGYNDAAPHASGPENPDADLQDPPQNSETNDVVEDEITGKPEESQDSKREIGSGD